MRTEGVARRMGTVSLSMSYRALLSVEQSSVMPVSCRDLMPSLHIFTPALSFPSFYTIPLSHSPCDVLQILVCTGQVLFCSFSWASFMRFPMSHGLLYPTGKLSLHGTHRDSSCCFLTKCCLFISPGVMVHSPCFWNWHRRLGITWNEVTDTCPAL